MRGSAARMLQRPRSPVVDQLLSAVDFPVVRVTTRGADDALVLAAITAIVCLVHRRHSMQGRLLALVVLLYETSRFALDFLRARDIPYARRGISRTHGRAGCLRGAHRLRRM